LCLRRWLRRPRPQTVSAWTTCSRSLLLRCRHGASAGESSLVVAEARRGRSWGAMSEAAGGCEQDGSTCGVTFGDDSVDNTEARDVGLF
jgi:hypothetical protein